MSCGYHGLSTQQGYRRRLRQPESEVTVRGSLPVLHFGDPSKTKVATVGINPAPTEYLDRNGLELSAEKRRLATLGLVKAKSRDSISDEQCDDAIKLMQQYFHKNPYRQYFNPLCRVLDGAGWSYEDGTAVHLDLVQESTNKGWSELKQESFDQACKLWQSDPPFFIWQVETLHLTTLFCDGKEAWNKVLNLTDGSKLTSGKVESVSWQAGRGHVAGAPVSLAGWNQRLNRSGLTKQDNRRLGLALANALKGMES